MESMLTGKGIEILLVVAAVALVLYMLGIPGGVIALVGVGVWALTLVAQGGHMEGNPYKRMRYTSPPSFVTVTQYQKRREQEVKDQASTEVTVFMFLLGLEFMLVGLVAHLLPWSIWSVL
ncbi:MAG: hypothetical protein LN417_06095 [Candidatus Thermoplasmatota archaeon]|nr:hypothetical protein [Candidatus Thermoplasmatota archaeon]